MPATIGPMRAASRSASCLLLLTLARAPAAQEAPPSPAGAASAVPTEETAESLATSLRARLDLAVAAAADGREAEALGEMLWLYDHGLDEGNGFYATRLTTLLEHLGRLARRFPEARSALDQRRASLEARLVAGEGGWQEATDIAAIDAAMGQGDRTVETHDLLAATRPAGDAARVVLFNVVLDRLVAAKRYEDVVLGAGDLHGRFDEAVAGFHRTAALLSTGLAPLDEERLAPLRERIVEQGASYYEALLGAGETSRADTLAASVLAFAGSVETTTTLQARAVRAGDRDALRRLDGSRVQAER